MACPGQMFSGLSVDDVVVMPNHIHGIVQIHEPVKAKRGAVVGTETGTTTNAPAAAPLVGTPDVPAPITVGRIVGAFKSCSTNGYIRGVRTLGWKPFRGRLWQRNYHERVLRDEAALMRVRQYIKNNPRRWWLDRS